MAQYTCTGCVPIDAKIIDVYIQLLGLEERTTEAAERAEYAAEHAIGKSPYIGENGDWWEWNDEQGVFVDTGVQAKGSVAVDIEMSATSTNPVQNRVITNALNQKYTKPASGIPASDIASGVIPDVSQFVTASVNNLVNYYLKSETYTKAEVQALIAAIDQFSYEVAASLPTASASTMNKIYLVPSAEPKTQNTKDEFITLRSGSAGSYTYAWEQIGSTAIDLSGYVTTQQLNTALAAYTTTANLTTLLAAKQDVVSDLATIRSGAAAGATAYQKPAGGIPKTDLESGVQDSLDLADTAIQARPQGEITPVVTPADYATREELGELEAKLPMLGGYLVPLLRKVVYKDDDAESLIAGINALLNTVEVTSISAVYTQPGTIYAGQPLDDLKANLVVTANYNDGSSAEVSTYELSGTLTAGTSSILVTYQEFTTTFNVTVTDAVHYRDGSYIPGGVALRNAATASNLSQCYTYDGVKYVFTNGSSTTAVKRCSYFLFDLLLTAGKQYKFTVEFNSAPSSSQTFDIGIGYYDETYRQAGVANVYQACDYSSHLNDSGWQTTTKSGNTITMSFITPEGCVGGRLTMRYKSSGTESNWPSSITVKRLIIQEVTE